MFPFGITVYCLSTLYYMITLHYMITLYYMIFCYDYSPVSALPRGFFRFLEALSLWWQSVKMYFTKMSTRYHTTNSLWWYIGKLCDIDKYPFRPRWSSRWFEDIVNILDFWLFLNAWGWLWGRCEGWCSGRPPFLWITSSFSCKK